MLIRVIDFETTGFPPDAGIVEIGWCDVRVEENGEDTPSITVGEWQNQLVNPGRKIEIAARAVHHISDVDLVDCPPPDKVLQPLIDGVDYFAAHNARFEQEFFKPGETTGSPVPWICTLKLAYRLCPKAPNHQNQTIRYYLDTACDPSLCMPAHRAGPDAYVTAHTLAKFLTAKIPVETFVKWSEEPPLLPYCPIGTEWKGRPWNEVDAGFLGWILKTKTMDEDIKHNARRELNRRKGA